MNYPYKMIADTFRGVAEKQSGCPFGAAALK
jgi:hypothetical protein